jgi:hypothetical protein
MKPENSKDNSVRIAEEEDLEAPKKIEEVVLFLPIDRKRENSATDSKPSDRCKSGFLPIGKRGLTNSPLHVIPWKIQKQQNLAESWSSFCFLLFLLLFFFFFWGRRGCRFSGR